MTMWYYEKGEGVMINPHPEWTCTPCGALWTGEFSSEAIKYCPSCGKPRPAPVPETEKTNWEICLVRLALRSLLLDANMERSKGQELTDYLDRASVIGAKRIGEIIRVTRGESPKH
jgi:predicted  nucleic acid-binding Zn-ribbon protein